ncbi:MAG: response regulator [Alphaproteobacteria bacterium]|nr:response regulator [Alphaproteobacteria bacterium]
MATPEPELPPLRDRFHEELRRNNASALLWATTVFDLFYVLWTFFDRALAPEHATEFLWIRVGVAVFGTGVAIWARRPGNDRYAWEAFWIWLFACGAGISVMLPHVAGAMAWYVLGYSLILFGGGLLPFWRPKFALSNVAAILASSVLAFVVWPTDALDKELVGTIFAVLTAAGASVMMALYKYWLLEQEFKSRDEARSTSRELARALQRLEAQDRMKNRFFANISHELRTPLTLILSPVQTLLDRASPGTDRRSLQTVADNAERLLRLIDDLLELSRLDAGFTRLKLGQFDPGELARDNVERARPALSAKGLKLALAIDDDLPRMWGDEHRLDIVLTNLVGNAIKYTPDDGSVTVVVSRCDDGVRFAVHDTGPGIAPDDLEQVFDRFFQSERADRNRVGGVGIGLALAKELVELHEGRMEVESTVGEGSCFSFVLREGRDHIRPEVIDRRGGVAERRTTQRPGQSAGRRATDLPPPVLPADAEPGSLATELADDAPLVLERGRRPRVLLAEDEDELRRYIAELLAGEFEVIEAPDGSEAWERARELRPDLVLTDVMMPGMSGSELCRAIKSDPALHTTPVILLTARAGTDATLRAYAVGADDFVAKPFHHRVLVARVQAQLKLRALSAELAQRERLAAVGTLAAGILHEVRNPLNAVLSATRTLGRPDLPDPVRTRLLAVIQDGADRIHGLTTTLDAHVRPAEGEAVGLCDLGAGIDATLRLLEHRMSGVTVHRKLKEGVTARAAPGPVNQVLLNLIDNALMAGAKTLWITAFAAQDRARIVIEDDGPGIPPGALDRLFDAFFTTKAPGEGSGLGLYLSRQIIEQQGGRIQAENRDDGGARFIVELPAPPRVDGSPADG